MIYPIQENDVMPLLAGTLIYLSFQNVGNFSYITLQTKKEEFMLKHCWNVNLFIIKAEFMLKHCWNVDLFELSDCWQLFLYNSSNKKRTIYAKALQSLVRMPLNLEHVCQTPYFHVGNTVIY